jgi:tRNA pseudouridine38-40 synthase
MPRIALGIEYDGTDFAGWQSQANARSVQAELERSVSRVADEAVVVNAAGRTDAGVHAAGQVAHFDTRAGRSTDQWLFGINSSLPEDVSIRWVREVAPDFDARRSASSRRYVYLIHQGKARSALLRRYAWWLRGRLEIDAMRQASRAWIGEHDFSAFRAAGCQSRTPMRCLQEVRISSLDDCVTLEFAANAFLYHMVRNLVGTLVEIGLQRQPVSWARELLAGLSRADAGATAPPCGLTLVAVNYARVHEIPIASPPVWLVPHGA